MPTSRIMKPPTAPSLSVLHLIRDTPFLTRLSIVARRDKGSKLLTLHGSNSRRLEGCKFSPSPSTFRLAESETQSNILIDDMGNPRLTDFGFSSITMNDRSVNASTENRRGSTRWRAPELLALSTKVVDKGKAKSTRPTRMSDVYSLAMVVIEVKFPHLAQGSISQSSKRLQIFTGRQPFYLYSDEQVILLLAKGSRPDKPVHEQFTSGMWSLTKMCWNKEPQKRPDVSEVLEKLGSKQGAFSFIHAVSLAQEASRKGLAQTTSGFFECIHRFLNKPHWRKAGCKPLGLILAARRPCRIFCIVFEVLSVLEIAVPKFNLTLDPGVPHFPNAFHASCG